MKVERRDAAFGADADFYTQMSLLRKPTEEILEEVSKSLVERKAEEGEEGPLKDVLFPFGYLPQVRSDGNIDTIIAGVIEIASMDFRVELVGWARDHQARIDSGRPTLRGHDLVFESIKNTFPEEFTS